MRHYIAITEDPAFPPYKCDVLGTYRFQKVFIMDVEDTVTRDHIRARLESWFKARSLDWFITSLKEVKRDSAAYRKARAEEVAYHAEAA